MRVEGLQMRRRKQKMIQALPQQPSSNHEMREKFEAKTKGQKEYIRSMIENDVVFATGPAGTGKSYLALGLACQYLLDGRYDKIVICRPTVEASPKGLGFIPGDISEKLSPYVMPAVEHIKKFIGRDRYYKEFHLENIKFEALEYMRGRTFSNSFIIVEEAQNCTTEQLKMIVTRIGEDSKIVINGDVDQTDLKIKHGESIIDFEYVINKLERADLDLFGIVELTELDIIRNPLIAGFLRAMR
jgi:phosphate starvation-inducible PhoH-like protein